ncbi:MAG: hypothetical protein EA382_00665, partial [Spirochaetaceae bacterium]
MEHTRAGRAIELGEQVAAMTFHPLAVHFPPVFDDAPNRIEQMLLVYEAGDRVTVSLVVIDQCGERGRPPGVGGDVALGEDSSAFPLRE